MQVEDIKVNTVVKVNSTEKHPLIIKHVVITLTYD